MGEYEWKTYGEVLQEVKEFGRGLTETGMSPTKLILIFAETRADWMIAAQACFRQNFTGELQSLPTTVIQYIIIN